jgi:insulin receptor
MIFIKWCSERWRVNNVAPNIDDSDENQMHLITNLQPYTQYAIFVQTYTVALQQMGKRVGARSPILYERTSPAGK